MLYDVLPPLVFFTSLGGTILVVSRVMVRIRRQKFATAARAPRARDLAVLLRPSQKSVHEIKDRLALVRHTIYHSVTKVRSELRRRRQQLRRAIPHTSLPAAKPDSQALQKKQPRDQFKPQLHVVETKPTKRTEPTPQPTKQSGLKKLFPAKKSAATPLEQARRALTADRCHHVETILVPYIIKHPKATPAYILLGKAALRRGAWEEAVEVFEQVVNLKPTAKGGYALLGYAAYKAGKFTKAIEAFQKAHDADPQNTNIIKRLLKIARRLDNVPLQHSLLAELTSLEQTRAIESSEPTPRILQ